MIYAVIIILIVLVLVLSLKLAVIRKQMRRIAEEMHSNKDGRDMHVDFVDADLEKLICEVNKLYEYVMSIRAEGRENEKKIKDSISMISHDMRTPLTSVIGYLQLAEKATDPEEANANLRIALERARYLNRLVNDLFELSLIESGQMDISAERLNICEIICEEILAESPEIDKKGMEPSFEQADENIYVTADKKKLSRIVQNLISNAVRYSQKTLEFKIETAASDMVKIRIITDSDKAVDTEKIFDRFVKGDSSRTNDGAGLGLYICKSFAAVMGGDISAQQDEERFIITLSLPG